jgi:putative chitinase
LREGRAVIDRDKFFDSVRADPFGGNLIQSQVDGLNFLLDVWEEHFAPSHPRDGTMFLAYALATAFHETAQTMEPIEEYGKGGDAEYAQPAGPYGNCYWGRGFVQLTWLSNYEKGEAILRDSYKVECPMVRYPHRMLEHEPAALILYDGSIDGWFTGVGLPQYFNAEKGIEDPYNARRVINGTDKADTIKGYYLNFKEALA